jgi:hypothetical protein
MNRWRCYVIVRMSCAHRLSSAAALSLEVEAMTQTRSSRVLRVRWIAWWRAMGNSVVINHSKPTRRHQGPRQAQIGSRRVERPSRKSFFTAPPRQNRRGRGSRCQGGGSERGISQLAVAGTLVLRRDPAPLEPEPRRRGLQYTCACSEVTYLRCLWQSGSLALAGRARLWWPGSRDRLSSSRDTTSKAIGRQPAADSSGRAYRWRLEPGLYRVPMRSPLAGMGRRARQQPQRHSDHLLPGGEGRRWEGPRANTTGA